MSLSPVPNQAPTYSRARESQDIRALYEYLGRLRGELETQLAAVNAILADHEARITVLEP